jgi:hypothetical protein
VDAVPPYRLVLPYRKEEGAVDALPPYRLLPKEEEAVDAVHPHRLVHCVNHRTVW